MNAPRSWEVRDALRLKRGDRVVFLRVGEQVIVRKEKPGRLSETLQNQRPRKEGALQL
jgi:bifunctional DNA-binding transcriptional regulator/antitoxin component of YhaV-PrlF toxin-antitoxin module